ncbi:MAG: L-histidine N(alpha)-methyltransferase [Bacteroidales bacterium]|nr:L-histidine N(alpha)-methyltransferase [Bacteroidales bacterium]MCF8457499.1 L-histidine N(alpha)-methyltransferase [Bacteroidales bacterium]
MEQIAVLTDFAKDTLEGLTSQHKYLSSKYFYDDRGSKIFQDIMRMPEYYLTDCELEIFQTQKQEILADFLGSGSHFDLLELGAGDGLKTKVLLAHFLNQKVNFRYTPIDISEVAVINLVSDLEHELAGLEVNGLVGDYFDLIGDDKLNGHTKKIILFLGSNIGNFNRKKSLAFLRRLGEAMNPNDQLFIGFDLKKESDVILNAYNDPYGHTAAFNLNLLQRINNELDADFDLSKFIHQEVYDPQTGTAKSYLISQKNQQVRIHELDQTIYFDAGEKVYTEMSQKYDSDMIQDLATGSGFEVVRNYCDQRQYFVNSLWKLKT